MPSWAELLPFGVLGVLGGLHCATMCGGFALAVTAMAPGWRGATVALLLYAFGKALTYAALGALFAWTAQAALHSGALLAGDGAAHRAWVLRLQSSLAVASALGFCVFAAGAFGWASPGWLRSRRLGSRVSALLGFLNAQVLALPRRGRGFYLGAVNGLLPCGLTLAALALATAGSTERGALGMGLFGASTAPALLAVGLGGRPLIARAGGRARRRWLRLAGVLALIFALVTFSRGLGGVQGPGCCSSAAPAVPVPGAP